MNCENATNAIRKHSKTSATGQKTSPYLVKELETNSERVLSNLVIRTRTRFDRCQYSETREEGWKTCENSFMMQEKTDLWRRAKAKLTRSETYCNIILQWILRKRNTHNNEVKIRYSWRLTEQLEERKERMSGSLAYDCYPIKDEPFVS